MLSTKHSPADSGHSQGPELSTLLRTEALKHLVWGSEHLLSACPQQHHVTLLCLSFLLCEIRMIIYPQNPCEESMSYSIMRNTGTAQHIVNIQVLGVTFILVIYFQPSCMCHAPLCVTWKDKCCPDVHPIPAHILLLLTMQKSTCNLLKMCHLSPCEKTVLWFSSQGPNLETLSGVFACGSVLQKIVTEYPRLAKLKRKETRVSPFWRPQSGSWWEHFQSIRTRWRTPRDQGNESLSRDNDINSEVRVSMVWSL